jgi:SAM-dependent methyltransferase
VKCELCDAEAGFEVVLTLERQILRCGGCGLVFADPNDVPPGGRPYSEAYYHGGVYVNYLGDRPAIERNAVRVLSHLRTLTSGRRLLDVGCAAGFFLVAARNTGWTVRGLEVSEYMAEYARREFGLSVILGSIEAPHPDQVPPCDVVTLWDTIEHLAHPVGALANIRRLLNPGGLLVLSTGDHGSLLRRITGRRWRLFGDPTHNFFLSETTLTRLLARTGFRVVSLEKRGKWVSLSMILHQSGIPFATNVQQFLENRGWNPRFYVNLRDIMTVHARAHE